MNNAILSIAIPTHNRAKYAISAIESLLKIPETQLEIVVSDTSTDGLLQSALEGSHRWMLNDPRLKYIRPASRLDMTGNHNVALGETSGEYICLIGDDDTVTQEAVTAARWGAVHKVEVIAPDVVANYAWPDFRSRYFGAGHASRLYLAPDFTGWRWIESELALRAALANAGQGTDGLPKIYHGLVHRNVLERMRATSGAYFHGSSPDVSGAMGLAAITSRFLVVRYPLTIPGASGGSNTGRSALNQHKGRLGGEAQTKAFVNAGWSAGVPRFFSVETVWAHAALETLNHLAPARLKDYNFARLLGICNVLHKEYSSEIQDACAEVCSLLAISRGDLMTHVGREQHQFRLGRYAHLIKRALRPTAAGGRQHVDGIETVADAPLELEKVLRARNLSWAQFASTIQSS